MNKFDRPYLKFINRAEKKNKKRKWSFVLYTIFENKFTIVWNFVSVNKYIAFNSMREKNIIGINFAARCLFRGRLTFMHEMSRGILNMMMKNKAKEGIVHEKGNCSSPIECHEERGKKRNLNIILMQIYVWLFQLKKLLLLLTTRP